MRFNFEATGIGSVPFKDSETACNIIFDNFPSIPFWPQMPKISFLENMYVQYSENMPGLVLDKNNKTIHINSHKFVTDIDKVYGKYIDEDMEFFAISEDHAKGLYEFLHRLEKPPKNIKYIKGHIVGPISYALTLVDENKRSVLYNKDIFEILTKVLVMKARWQIRKLKSLFPKVIIFIDEPSLVSLGSSYVSINSDGAFEKLDELIKAIKDEGALCGLHCCGNTDWPLLLKRDIDIISFDAYNFTKEFLLYSTELKEFIGKGRSVAWGVVPTSDDIGKETAEGLHQRLSAAASSGLITPSCGVGTLGEHLARKVFEMTRQVSDIMQEKYGRKS